MRPMTSRKKCSLCWPSRGAGGVEVAGSQRELELAAFGGIGPDFRVVQPLEMAASLELFVVEQISRIIDHAGRHSRFLERPHEQVAVMQRSPLTDQPVQMVFVGLAG